MAKLDRNESLTLLRILVNAQRQTSHGALDQCRASIRNDRQFAQIEKSIRATERRLREETLVNAQNLGIIDHSVTADDLRHMR